MVTVVDNPAAMAAYVGSKLGTSEWVALDQQKIDALRRSLGMTTGSMWTCNGLPGKCPKERLWCTAS